MFTLYNAAQSTCSQKVRITLAEKEQGFSDIQLNLFTGDQFKPEYLKINPNGVVPTLMHDDSPIVDSSVIIEYLDEIFPENPLTPSSPLKRARMRALMRFFEEVPTPAVRFPSYNNFFSRHFEKMSDEEFQAFADAKPLRRNFFMKMGRTGFGEAEMNAAMHSLQLTVERMEKELEVGPWLLGEAFSLADICVVPVLARLEDIGLDSLWQDSPLVAQWLGRFKERPSYRKAMYYGSMLSEKYGQAG
ncbi:MAG: glutathione S-transferase family protein [Halopseudomonas sp.]